MFRFILISISWGAYWQGLLILVPIYYLVVLVLFFRKDSWRWLSSMGSLGKTTPVTTQDRPVASSADSSLLSSPDSESSTNSHKDGSVD